MDIITSRENKWLKLFRAALQGSGPKVGESVGVEGTKMVEDAIRSGLETEALLVSESGERELPRILRASSNSDAGIPRGRILRTTDKLFQNLSGTETPQGVAALFQQPVWGLEDVLRGPKAMRQTTALVIVLAGVQDPGNVGTIVRSAEGFGATGVVASRGTADPWSPKALRASAGAALRLPVLRGMANPVLLAQLKMQQVKVLVARSPHPADADATTRWEDSLQGAAAIFIGNEGAGLPPEVEHAADAVISIPISEALESLNAGVAASIVLYEAARQRRRTA